MVGTGPLKGQDSVGCPPAAQSSTEFSKANVYQVPNAPSVALSICFMSNPLGLSGK